MPDGSETADKPKYSRVLMKISGEALMGDQGFGLHPPTVAKIAGEVKKVHDLGVVASSRQERLRKGVLQQVEEAPLTLRAGPVSL